MCRERHRTLESQQQRYVPRPKHSGVREKSSIAMSPCAENPRIASNLATNLHVVQKIDALHFDFHHHRHQQLIF